MLIGFVVTFAVCMGGMGAVGVIVGRGVGGLIGIVFGLSDAFGIGEKVGAVIGGVSGALFAIAGGFLRPPGRTVHDSDGGDSDGGDSDGGDSEGDDSDGDDDSD